MATRDPPPVAVLNVSEAELIAVHSHMIPRPQAASGHPPRTPEKISDSSGPNHRHPKPGRPIPHPHTGRPADFVFTAHGRRLGQNGLRAELNRAATDARIGHVTPHTNATPYATALVNAGVSLQALMALLGHVSAEMSLRYGHLFDTTIRAEYERALDLARTRIGTLPEPGRGPSPPDAGASDWLATPTIKTAWSGGYCLRASPRICSYAYLCEHCPRLRHQPRPHRSPQRATRPRHVLAQDATTRGWDSETERHLRLFTRLNDLLDNPTTRPNAM